MPQTPRDNNVNTGQSTKVVENSFTDKVMVQQTAAEAVHTCPGGARTGQTVGQAPGIFAISGAEVAPAPSRHHSVTVVDDEGNSGIMEVKVCVLVCSLIFGSLPDAMIVVGILDFDLCPGHIRLATYMIVQGATSVVIPILASWWFCCKCISGVFIVVFCVIIGLFNIAWGIVGLVWLASSPCGNTLLFTHALGFSIPMWIFFCLVWMFSLFKKKK